MVKIANSSKSARPEFPHFAAVTAIMYRAIVTALLLLISLRVAAEVPRSYSAVSPVNRVALLELYTSEGCSSCPPADRFMSRLKLEDISDQKLIPLSFHVTYWDYIGWKDRFGDSLHDARQRKQARLNNSSMVYTPQFIMNGKDFRRHGSFDDEIVRINSITADYRLELTASVNKNVIEAVLGVKTLVDDGGEAVAYIALYEHGLGSEVTGGENEGKQLRHDYVVREFKGPYLIGQDQAEFNVTFQRSDYVIVNSGIVAFIQQPMSAEVLQAVRLRLIQ